MHSCLTSALNHSADDRMGNKSESKRIAHLHRKHIAVFHFIGCRQEAALVIEGVELLHLNHYHYNVVWHNENCSADRGFCCWVFLVAFGVFLPSLILHTHAYFRHVQIWMYQFLQGREHGQSRIGGRTISLFLIYEEQGGQRLKRWSRTHCIVRYHKTQHKKLLIFYFFGFSFCKNCIVISVSLMTHTSINSSCNEPHIPGITHKTTKKSHSILVGV